MTTESGASMELTWTQSVVIFVGGGLLISLGDRAHIECGILTQDNTGFFGQAWWVVPLFGTVSLTLIYTYRALRRWFDEPIAPRQPKKVVFNAVLFLLAYASTGPFAEHGYTLAAILTGLWLVRVLVHQENRATLVLAVLIAVLGPMGESIVAMLGMFQYTSPDLWLVHSWLPPIYLHGALVVPPIDAYFYSNVTSSRLA